MMFAQRYPELFDGIVAVAPAMRVAEGAAIAAAWTVQKLLAIAPRGADGQPVLARSLSNDDLEVVANAVLERCDADDGLKDGLVQRACTLDPAVLQCPGDKAPGCLARPQVDAVRDVMAGPRDSAGRSLYFGWPWDPGIAAPDWRNWTLGTAGDGQPPNARHITLMAGALGHEFVTPPDPSLSTINFDFDRDPSLEMEDYQRRIEATHGPASAAALSRLFLVPGMNHCSGGPATDAFDGLAAITRWVETGEAPERIVAHGTSGALEGLTRPLCRWPKVATYGSGEPSEERSFVCR
jgi:feruloyl esterase